MRSCRSVPRTGVRSRAIFERRLNSPLMSKNPLRWFTNQITLAGMRPPVSPQLLYKPACDQTR